MFTCSVCGHRATHEVTVTVDASEDRPDPFFRVLEREYCCDGHLADLSHRLRQDFQFHDARLVVQQLERSTL